MQKELKNNKQKIAIIFLGISLLLLVFNTPFRSMGYVVGRVFTVVIFWSIILGIIAYFIWRFIFKKRKELLLIFSILFLLAAIFQFAENIFKGYVMQKISNISQPLNYQDYNTNNSPKICFFPIEKAYWNGYEVTTKNWDELDDYQRLKFVKEALQEIATGENVAINSPEVELFVQALDEGISELNKKEPNIQK